MTVTSHEKGSIPSPRSPFFVAEYISKNSGLLRGWILVYIDLFRHKAVERIWSPK